MTELTWIELSCIALLWSISALRPATQDRGDRDGVATECSCIQATVHCFLSVPSPSSLLSGLPRLLSPRRCPMLHNDLLRSRSNLQSRPLLHLLQPALPTTLNLPSSNMRLIVRLPPQAPCGLDERLALLLYDWWEVGGFHLLVVEGEVVRCFWEEVVEGAEEEEGWGEETDGEGAWEGGASRRKGAIVKGSESHIRDASSLLAPLCTAYSR